MPHSQSLLSTNAQHDGAIHDQCFNSRAPRGRYANNLQCAPTEMVVPQIPTRMKQRNRLT